MTDTIRIAVVDDHPLYREGVVSVLQHAGGFNVVGQGGTRHDAISIANSHFPDMMLVDITMPGGGIEAVRAISENRPVVKVIMLTASERQDDVAAALEAGARGYILKGISGGDLVNVMRSIHRGESYVSPGLAARLLTQLRRRPADAEAEEDLADLTVREEEILGHVSAGLTNKEIAIRLGISEKTVKHYMTNIMQKLQVRNRVEAVMTARRRSVG
jgi:DNA-binding NarL/FixJ family response regulator